MTVERPSTYVRLPEVEHKLKYARHLFSTGKRRDVAPREDSSVFYNRRTAVTVCCFGGGRADLNRRNNGNAPRKTVFEVFKLQKDERKGKITPFFYTQTHSYFYPHVYIHVEHHGVRAKRQIRVSLVHHRHIRVTAFQMSAVL